MHNILQLQYMICPSEMNRLKVELQHVPELFNSLVR